MGTSRIWQLARRLPVPSDQSSLVQLSTGWHPGERFPRCNPAKETLGSCEKVPLEQFQALAM
jgi:hypothetical protein